jgi:far upstream element-binding protein
MIQSESGAKLDIDRDTSQVVISGEPDQIRKAKELIQGIVDGKDMGPPPEAQNRIETKSAGAIIGAGGVTIRKIQVDSGARVDIDKTGDIDVITISGSHAQVAKATQLVDNVLNPKYDCKDYMDVGIKGVPLVVGSKGATIKALQTSTGCKIDIENGATVVGMFGTDAAVKACRNAIQKLITDNLYEEEVECAASQVGAIIGKGGETIRKIQTESGARVNISRDDNKVSTARLPVALVVSTALCCVFCPV